MEDDTNGLHSQPMAMVVVDDSC